ncbi:MAG: hypothetical protein RSB93_01890 [Rikenellaceae bacterium]
MVPLLFCSCYHDIDSPTSDIDYYIALSDDLCDNEDCMLKEKRYFIIGNERKLWEDKIIRRIKGFTRQYDINPVVQKKAMKEIDAIHTDCIYVGGSKIRVLGVIPKQSYTINGNIVIIKNKHMFWRYNKLLVITYRE